MKLNKDLLTKNAEQERKSEPVHIDISTGDCALFVAWAEHELCPDVVMLNRNASTGQLLGFLYGRCRELRNLAKLGTVSEIEDREYCEVLNDLHNGLHTVVDILSHLGNRLDRATTKGTDQ